jgi:large subunit ribosomal protein L6
MEKENKLEKEIEIPEGVSVIASEAEIKVSSGGVELSKEFQLADLSLAVEGNKLKITAERSTRRTLKLYGTLKAIINNMFAGTKENFVYKLKICSGHFPMNVTVSNADITIKNFLGESVPRKAKFPEGVIVKMDGDVVTVEGPDKEKAGLAAARIEQLTKVKGRDSRVFQDGIYITQKHHRTL